MFVEKRNFIKRSLVKKDILQVKVWGKWLSNRKCSKKKRSHGESFIRKRDLI
jgi:hypothetical protein